MAGFRAVLILAAAAAVVVGAPDAAPPASREELSPEKSANAEVSSSTKETCGESCRRKYDVKGDLLRSCESGCRLLSIIDAITSSPVLSNGEQNESATMRSCHGSCVASYHGPGQADACQQGCFLQAPHIKDRKKVVMAPAKSFFDDDADFGFPMFGGSGGGGGDGGRPFQLGFPLSVRRISLPSFFGFGHAPSPSGPPTANSAAARDPFRELESEAESMFSSSEDGVFGGGISDMFKRMHKQMNDMISNMMSRPHGVPALPQEDGQPGQSHGKMVVVQAGPGYRQEKTYNFGPEGVETHVESHGNVPDTVAKEIGKDMMTHFNPLEKFFKTGDVDFLSDEPSSYSASSSSSSEKYPEDFSSSSSSRSNSIEGEDFGSDSDSGSDEREHEIRDRDRSRSRNRNSATVHGYDFEFEGPKLPEVGLRPKNAETCSQDDTTWSEWVNCLHLRMGLPRWLTACTLSLGVVFIIWLCLVIPQNAPRQRVVLSAKEIEAAGGAVVTEKGARVSTITSSGPPSYNKLDLPPTYEEAGLHVAIPSAAAAASKAAEAEAVEGAAAAAPTSEKKKPDTTEEA